LDEPPRKADAPTDSPPRPPARETRTFWPQYSRGTFLRAMLIFSVLAAVLGGMLRGMQEEALSPAGFIVMALVAPLAVLLAISLVNGLAAAWKSLRRRR